MSLATAAATDDASLDLTGQSPAALFFAATAVLLRPDADPAAIRGAHDRLDRCSQLVHDARVFSPNEEWDDINTADLPLLLVDAYLADAVGRLRTASPAQRLIALGRIRTLFARFLNQCHRLGLASAWEVAAADSNGGSRPAMSADTKRTEKIARFKAARDRERALAELHDQLAAATTRTSAANRRPTLPPAFLASVSSAFGPSSASSSASAPRSNTLGERDEIDDLLDEDDDEVLSRDFVKLLVTHWVAKAVDELAAVNDELPHLERMLRDTRESAPAQGDPHDAERRDRRTEAELAARLDGVQLAGRTGPLLDKNGRPMRPFTIVSQRAVEQGKVFRPGHRLPTMSIEEYLDAEMARGGILPAQDPNAAKKEDEDSDDEEVSLRKTYKAREWDAFTDDAALGKPPASSSHSNNNNNNKDTTNNNSSLSWRFAGHTLGLGADREGIAHDADQVTLRYPQPGPPPLHVLVPPLRAFTPPGADTVVLRKELADRAAALHRDHADLAAVPLSLLVDLAQEDALAQRQPGFMLDGMGNCLAVAPSAVCPGRSYAVMAVANAVYAASWTVNGGGAEMALALDAAPVLLHAFDGPDLLEVSVSLVQFVRSPTATATTAVEQDHAIIVVRSHAAVHFLHTILGPASPSAAVIDTIECDDPVTSVAASPFSLSEVLISTNRQVLLWRHTPGAGNGRGARARVQVVHSFVPKPAVTPPEVPAPTVRADGEVEEETEAEVADETTAATQPASPPEPPTATTPSAPSEPPEPPLLPSHTSAVWSSSPRWIFAHADAAALFIDLRARTPAREFWRSPAHTPIRRLAVAGALLSVLTSSDVVWFAARDPAVPLLRSAHHAVRDRGQCPLLVTAAVPGKAEMPGVADIKFDPVICAVAAPVSGDVNLALAHPLAAWTPGLPTGLEHLAHAPAAVIQPDPWLAAAAAHTRAPLVNPPGTGFLNTARGLVELRHAPLTGTALVQAADGGAVWVAKLLADGELSVAAIAVGPRPSADDIEEAAVPVRVSGAVPQTTADVIAANNMFLDLAPAPVVPRRGRGRRRVVATPAPASDVSPFDAHLRRLAAPPAPPAKPQTRARTAAAAAAAAKPMGPPNLADFASRTALTDAQLGPGRGRLLFGAHSNGESSPTEAVAGGWDLCRIMKLGDEDDDEDEATVEQIAADLRTYCAFHAPSTSFPADSPLASSVLAAACRTDAARDELGSRVWGTGVAALAKKWTLASSPAAAAAAAAAASARLPHSRVPAVKPAAAPPVVKSHSQAPPVIAVSRSQAPPVIVSRSQGPPAIAPAAAATAAPASQPPSSQPAPSASASARTDLMARRREEIMAKARGSQEAAAFGFASAKIGPTPSAPRMPPVMPASQPPPRIAPAASSEIGRGPIVVASASAAAQRMGFAAPSASQPRAVRQSTGFGFAAPTAPPPAPPPAPRAGNGFASLSQSAAGFAGLPPPPTFLPGGGSAAAPVRTGISLSQPMPGSAGMPRIGVGIGLARPASVAFPPSSGLAGAVAGEPPVKKKKVARVPGF
ncbi:Type 2A phosphatase-associated protein 42 [Blastocladiella emersonii ATCC 22665]|nr:Type 2A phosphatase-associated protein 42 [Blastocladiella emersonii ATCC 22665]